MNCMNRKIGSIFFACLLAACHEDKKTSREAFPETQSPPSPEMMSTKNWPISPVTFPVDEAPHDVLTDWWYYSGHVVTEDNERYGVMFVIAQTLRNDLPAAYVANFGLSDAYQKKYKSEERSILVNRDQVTFGGSDGFHFNVKGWTLDGLSGVDHIHAHMSDGSYGINLRLQDIKGIALPGNGTISYGENIPFFTYYYERPRMAVTGDIIVGKQKKHIKEGVLWFDRQWGNFLVLTVGNKWEWFSVLLNDGSDIMFYTSSDENGESYLAYGVYIPPCVSTCKPNTPITSYDIPPDNISVAAKGYWTSPKTGIRYPIDWRAHIKGTATIPTFDLLFTPVIHDAEILHNDPILNKLIYWENDSMITGTKNGQPIAGSGFVELVGYAQKQLPPHEQKGH